MVGISASMEQRVQREDSEGATGSAWLRCGTSGRAHLLIRRRLRTLPRMAEIACAECGYRVNIVRTGPHSAKPEHDYGEFQRLCRVGPFRYITGTGCAKLDATYLAASRRGEF
jgi:hypothetical protein